MTLFTIYALTDPETNIIRYVGKTINPTERLRGYRHLRVHSPQTHCRSWIQSLQKQGLQPAMVVCDTCDDETTANDLERAWITLFRMAGVPLTNHTDGGEGITGYKHTEEDCRRMGNTRRGKPLSEKHCQAISEGNKGKHPSEETIQKCRDARSKRSHEENIASYGRLKSEETRRKIGEKALGRIVSDETRKKLSLSSLGRAKSAETRRKLSESNKGKVFSPETRRKMSESRRKRVVSTETGRRISVALKGKKRTKKNRLE